MSPVEFTDLTFPALGVNRSDEFGAQEPSTTIDAANVRFFEALTRRGRGGSRCGLSKYVLDRVGGLNSPVQHLALIATTDAAATLAAQDPYQGMTFPSAVFDPSDNGWADGNPGQPGPDGDTGGPPGGGTEAPAPGDPGGGGHTGPGDDPPYDKKVRNKGRKVRNGGNGITPIRSSPAAYPDGTQPQPGKAIKTGVVFAYNPDNIPYVYSLTLSDSTVAYGIGDGFTQLWPVGSHVVAEQSGTTQAGFGVPADQPVVTIKGV
jgi:hypothetical protein